MRRLAPLLHAREDQHLVPVAGLDQVRQQLLLALAAHRVHLLRDRLGRGIAARHLDQHRRVQQPVGQGLDLVAEGGREEQALLLRRQHREHLLDVVDEAHVEHAVGFVEHEDLDVLEVQRALLVVVEQAAGRGHQDVDALAQAVDLRLHADAAEHHHAGQRQVFAVGAHALFHLRGEFARGRQDEGADGDAAARVAHGLGQRQALQHRQREAGGLAGAGLRAAHQVAALQDDGNGLRLDRRRGVVALLANGAQERLGQAEVGELHVVSGPVNFVRGAVVRSLLSPVAGAPVGRRERNERGRKRPRRDDWKPRRNRGFYAHRHRLMVACSRSQPRAMR